MTEITIAAYEQRIRGIEDALVTLRKRYNSQRVALRRQLAEVRKAREDMVAMDIASRNAKIVEAMAGGPSGTHRIRMVAKRLGLTEPVVRVVWYAYRAREQARLNLSPAACTPRQSGSAGPSPNIPSAAGSVSPQSGARLP